MKKCPKHNDFRALVSCSHSPGGNEFCVIKSNQSVSQRIQGWLLFFIIRQILGKCNMQFYMGMFF